MRTDMRAGRLGGFTLVELFVVISVALIVIAVAVPAFSAMTASNARSLAENTLRTAVAVARDVALQSSRGNDAAAVFLFDPESGRMRVVAAEYVGTIEDGIDGAVSGGFLAPNTRVKRDVFAPVLVGETLVMPRGWMVRGYAPARTINSDWYDSIMYNDPFNAWDRGNWVFPEDGFYDVNRGVAQGGANSRTPRQSFMVRFEGKTGRLVRDAGEALLVDPRPSSVDRIPATTNRTDPMIWKRADLADDAYGWARRVLTEADLLGNGQLYQGADEAERRRLIGNLSHDTVLVRDVSRVALYNETELLRALGARDLSRRRAGRTNTGSMYASHADVGSIAIDFDGLFEQNSPFNASPAGLGRLRQSINRWIDGDTTKNADGTIGNGVFYEQTDEPIAMRYWVDTYSGELTEVRR